jgi:hypothetical protein
MAGIGNKIKEALTPGHRTDHVVGSNAAVDNRTSSHLMSQPNTYPTEGVAGTGGAIGSNAGYNTVDTGYTGTNAGAGMVREGGVAHNVAGSNTVCDTRTFTEVEDRPIMRERVERIIEHRPVEKQFVVETRPVGERELTEGVHYESAGVREYEVDRVQGSKCPTTTGTTGAGAVGGRTVL